MLNITHFPLFKVRFLIQLPGNWFMLMVMDNGTITATQFTSCSTNWHPLSCHPHYLPLPQIISSISPDKLRKILLPLKNAFLSNKWWCWHVKVIFLLSIEEQHHITNILNNTTNLYYTSHTWISNYIHYNMLEEITYPFLNFNGATVDV